MGKSKASLVAGRYSQIMEMCLHKSRMSRQNDEKAARADITTKSHRSRQDLQREEHVAHVAAAGTVGIREELAKLSQEILLLLEKPGNLRVDLCLRQRLADGGHHVTDVASLHAQHQTEFRKT